MKILGFFIVILLFVSLSVVPSPAADSSNTCKDPDSWKEWDQLVFKYPQDMIVQALHALRIGLCLKIERGDLTVEEATEIFNRLWDDAIREKQKQEQEQRAKEKPNT